VKLVLIGLRGTGKSTVGRVLAQRLNWECIDTDTLVEERAGKSIREIFETAGEPEFRKLEAQVVQEACLHKNAVIASGGGSILNLTSVAVMKNDGFVVHLSADPSELWHRICQDPRTRETRPKLDKSSDSELDELKKLMLSRAAAYANARDVEVDVEGRTPDEVSEAVLILMKAHGCYPLAAG